MELFLKRFNRESLLSMISISNSNDIYHNGVIDKKKKVEPKNRIGSHIDNEK